MKNRCEDCKHSGKRGWEKPCTLCLDSVSEKPMFERKAMTNADRIRSMTDEELAEFLLNTNHYYEDGQYFVRFGTVTISDETEDILYWLKADSEV